MSLLFLHQWIAIKLCKAICWTLVHSLWQGLFLSMFTWLIISFTTKRSPVLRYNLLMTSFFLFVLTTFATFAWQFHYAGIRNDLVETFKERIAPVITNTCSAHVSNARLTNYVKGFVDYLNAHAVLIAAIWFTLFSAKCLKFLSGFAQIKHLRQQKNRPSSDYWTNKLGELALALKINRRIVLFESMLIKVPAVIGWLKPIVLMPACLISSLSPTEVEAILLHELAHIKRRDYLVNLVQNYTEAIFFFHPAVYWVSSRMREERENCCDDMAIAVTGSRSGFIQVLLSFHEYNADATYAVALHSGDTQLVKRVKRIAYNNNQTLSMREKAFIIACFVIAGTFTLVFAQSSEKLAIIRNPSVNSRSSMPFGEQSESDQNNKAALIGKRKKKETKALKNNGYTKANGQGNDTIPHPSYKTLKNKHISFTYVSSSNKEKKKEGAIGDAKITDFSKGKVRDEYAIKKPKPSFIYIDN